MVIQTVLYPIDEKISKAENLKKAIKFFDKYFINKLGFGFKRSFTDIHGKHKPPHIKGNYIRFRQNEPLTKFQKKIGWKYATDKLKNGAVLVWMYNF